MRRTIILTGVFAVAACFTPPEGLEPAEQALRAAEIEGASEYLPEQLARVRDSIAEAKRELARQDQEPILTRSYRKSNRLFAKAEKEAIALNGQTVARRKVRFTADAEMQMLMLSVAIIEATFPETDDLDLWNALRQLDRAIEKAARQYRLGKYEQALDTIRAAQRLADDLPRDVVVDEGV